MKILIAPDKFKESLTAAEAARSIARGVAQVVPDAALELCPVADGGEGTVDALVAATNGELRRSRVTGPLGEAVEATWGLLGGSGEEAGGRTAVVEASQAAGLALVAPQRRDPTKTTTFGLGELIRAALEEGVARIIVGIGGSATNDGGTGMAQALGVRFEGGATPMTGGALGDLKGIDLSGLDERIGRTHVLVACDVTNPLSGPDGAAAVYGPQKGASPEQVAALDAGLAHLASLLPDVDPEAPGMGAAGGLGFGLVAFCNAQLTPGTELVLDQIRFRERLHNARLVLSGEGRLDGQSARGKACLGVAQAAWKHGVPTVALVGSLGPDAEKTLEQGLHAYHAIAGANVTVEEAIHRAAELLEELTSRVVGQYLL